MNHSEIATGTSFLNFPLVAVGTHGNLQRSEH